MSLGKRIVVAIVTVTGILLTQNTVYAEPVYLPVFERINNVKITYYCCEPYKHICGTGNGITATGTKVREGVVAVDPDVIPLGSIVYINGNKYIAEDTGGAIKGNRIDIAVSTHQEALNLGVNYADVYFLRD